MRLKIKSLLAAFCLVLVISSCESEAEKKKRLAKEKQERIELKAKKEKERRKKAIHDKYIDNSLETGATPYSKYYGGNSSCDNYGCSQLKVKTSDSDVIVIIKKSENVVRHAYISSNSSYKFSFPDGTYQTFFYYGKGWNPEKKMKGGKMKGGFIDNEDFGKDESQTLSNNILEYQLILRENGNFRTRPSNPEEAL